MKDEAPRCPAGKRGIKITRGLRPGYGRGRMKSVGPFEGRWIGESQGIERAAHIWEIRQVGEFVEIDNMWEGDGSFRQMRGKPVEGRAEFILTSSHRAVMLDSQHFVVAGWDSVFHGRKRVAEYDVVFSRPGIAELTAQQVWREWKLRNPADEPPAHGEDGAQR